MASGENITPSKTHISIQYTPSTKRRLCVLCGKREEKDSYRVRLFKNNEKTGACNLIEQYLSINISPLLHVDSLCQNCHRSLLTLQAKVLHHQNNYKRTVENLKKTHGQTSRKRLPFDETFVTQEPKRVSAMNPRPSENISMDIDEKTVEKAKITIEKGRKIQEFAVTQHFENLIECLLQEKFNDFIQLVCEKTELKDALICEATKIIQKEIKSVCKKDQLPSLSSKTEDSLSSLSWEKLSEELQSKTPTFWKFLEQSAFNPRQQTKNVKKTERALIPGIVSAGCKLISLHNRNMNAIQSWNSLILLKGGAKKSAFRRLSSSYDCLTYSTTLAMADNFSSTWEDKLVLWSDKVYQDSKIEGQIRDEIKDLKEETDLLQDHDDVLASATNMFCIADAEARLENHQSTMHPGFYFVGDNVDMRTNVRQMTLTNQSKDQHMYQMCAYKHRVNGNHLDNLKPKDDIETVPFSLFVPSEDEKSTLLDEFAHIVALQWTELIPLFRPYKTVLPSHIEHCYLKETSQKTERVNMGVLKKNEQYNEDMTDICSFLNKYVPGVSENDDDWQTKPTKILSGGDYLTFERHKQAQSSKRNGRTPSKRMEGLVPKMEEFHNQAEFLQVIWKILYSTSSSKDTGTLYAARNSINARNVSKDPGSNYYASSELTDKFTKAYIVAAALEHFSMTSIDSEPLTNTFTGEIGNSAQMKAYIISEARNVVKKFSITEFPSIPEDGYQSNNDIICQICGKTFKVVTSLTNHEVNIHGKVQEDPVKRKSKGKEQLDPSHDRILNYSKTGFTLGLLKLDHDDAIKMGDGERILRLDTFMYLHYKNLNCTKYAYGMLETLLQTKVLLSARLAHQLIWNRTVNHRGNVDTNHPNDMDIEHCNKVFKDEAHSHRGIFTEKVITRVSRSALKTDAVLKHFDKVTNVVRPSGKHTPADLTVDILTLVSQFQETKLFKHIPGRRHSAFLDMPENQLSSLDMNAFRDWLSRSMRKIAKKHFYQY